LLKSMCVCVCVCVCPLIISSIGFWYYKCDLCFWKKDGLGVQALIWDWD
jgi:hypothetical protein